MIYKFNDKSNNKAIKIIISIILFISLLLTLIYGGWLTVAAAFLISVFDFYYTRKINHNDKIKIKELTILEDKLNFSFFYKKKSNLILSRVDSDIIVNETQITFRNKTNKVVLGIAARSDIEKPEKWNDIIHELQTNFEQ